MMANSRKRRGHWTPSDAFTRGIVYVGLAFTINLLGDKDFRLSVPAWTLPYFTAFGTALVAYRAYKDETPGQVRADQLKDSTSNTES